MTTNNQPWREPLIHSHITDGLPEDHPLARVTVRCDGVSCSEMLHSETNECMQTWLETDWGNYCLRCFPIRDVLAPPADAEWRRVYPCCKCCKPAVTAFGDVHFCAMHADQVVRSVQDNLHALSGIEGIPTCKQCGFAMLSTGWLRCPKCGTVRS